MTRRAEWAGDVKAALPGWIATRVLTLLAWLSARWWLDARHHGVRPFTNALGLFAWDGAFYRGLAEHGYKAETTEALRFFPLYPLVGRALHALAAMPAGTALLVLGLGIVGGLHSATTDRTQAGQVADVIRAEAKPGDIVLICPDQLGPSLHRLLPARLGLQQLAYPTLADPSFVDWRDYADRNAAVNPTAVADEVVARARGGHTIWLVDSGSYKTLEGQCEAVEQELGAKVGSVAIRVNEDGGAFFEHESLVQYPGPAS